MLNQLLEFLSHFPAESIFCLEYILCFSTILLMFQLFGEIGLFSYIVLAVIISNIEVLKTVDVSFLGFPIALGTIVFSSSFIAVDILTELYGPERAKKSVWLGFAATLFVLLAMFLAIAMKPTIDSAGIDNALRLIFVPMPSIFFASLISYLTSQYIDIWIFQAVKNITSGKYLWARTILASSTAAFVDNVIFSLFAWVIFAANPASLHKLIHTYIIGTYIFRIVVIITQVPIMYFVRAMFKVRPKNAL